MSTVDVRVRLSFKPPEWISAAADGRPLFPALPRAAGVYSLRLSEVDGRQRSYVGESADLRRRGGNYRNPGPTQQTSQRIGALLREHLAAGATITLEVATAAEVHTNAGSEPLDLAVIATVPPPFADLRSGAGCGRSPRSLVVSSVAQVALESSLV